MVIAYTLMETTLLIGTMTVHCITHWMTSLYMMLLKKINSSTLRTLWCVLNWSSWE